MPRIEIVEDISPPIVQPPFVQTPFYTTPIRHEPTYCLLPPPLFQNNTPSKPELVHPEMFKIKANSVFSIISKFLDRVQSIEGIYFEMLDREMSQTHETVSTNIEKHMSHQNEIQKATESSDYWDFLRKIAVCLLGAASIVLGATLLTPDATALAIVAGSSLILSGGISILGNVLCDMRSHPQLSTALMVAGGGFALIGGISSAIMGVTTLTNVLGKVVVAGLSVVTSSAQIAKESFEWKLSNMKASYTQIQKASETCKERYRTMEKDLSTYEEDLSRATESCISAQLHHQAAIRKITARSGAIGAA